MSKKIITEELERIFFDSEDLDAVIKKLQNYTEVYKDYTNLRVNDEPVYDGGYFTYLYGDRLETDSEYASRIQWQKEAEDRNLAIQRKQYEELKAKFENEII